MTNIFLSGANARLGDIGDGGGSEIVGFYIQTHPSESLKYRPNLHRENEVIIRRVFGFLEILEELVARVINVPSSDRFRLVHFP